MYTIQYFAPYTQQIRTRTCFSYGDAMRMIEFYRSCGTKAVIVD